MVEKIIDKLTIEEMIQIIKISNMHFDRDDFDIYLNAMFEKNDAKVNYVSLINLLIRIEAPQNKIIKAVSKNIANIIDNYEDKKIWNEDLLETINDLLEKTKEAKEIEEIKQQIFKEYVKKYKKILKMSNYKMDVIKFLLSIGLEKEKIIEDRDFIKDNIYENDYLEFINFIKSNNIEFEKKPTPKEFLERLFSTHNDYSRIQNLPKLEIILTELMELEEVSLEDLSMLGEGSYSKAIKVGNYAMKMGSQRENDDVPLHPRIINSSYRTLLKTGVYETFVEIQECVDNKWYKDLSEEEIIEKEYEVFKELKDDGISWIDVKKENIGMKNGQLIVIDKDHLYTNPKDAMRLPNKYTEFLFRYQKEKKVRQREESKN